MICKHCDGDGVIVDVEYGHAGKYMCDYCWGTGVVEPLTEQEWLQTCTTEQLAEYILNVWLDGALNVNAEFGLNEAQIEKHKGYIVEWLKQPHTNKE